MNSEVKENCVMSQENVDAGERLKSEANEYFKSKFPIIYLINPHDS